LQQQPYLFYFDKIDMFEEKDGWTPLYIKKMLFKIAMVLLVIGGLNWLSVGAFDTDLVRAIFGAGLISDCIYILVGLAAVTIMCDRDTYLPFLGPTVVPCSVLQDRVPPGATKEVKIIVKPNAKVIYWAAEPANEKLKDVQSWKDAYQHFENAGVVTATQEGVAILKVRPPQAYNVPIRGKLEHHVHYRLCDEDGWMSHVYTTYLDKNKPEGFVDHDYKLKNKADTAASLY
jgi:uncharacterized membrane protein YuzA (DUF378 family)